MLTLVVTDAMTPDHADSRPVRRRTLLYQLGAGAVVAGLAGCTTRSRQRARADPVSLSQSAADLGLTLADEGSIEQRLTLERDGADERLTVESVVNAYSGSSMHVFLAATPRVVDAGEQRNDLVELSVEALLRADVGQPLRGEFDLVGEPDREWVRPLEAVASKPATVLGERGTATAYAGSTDEVSVRCYGVRVEHGDDAVFVIASQVRTIVPRPGTPLVGEDAVFSAEDIDEGLELFARTLEYVVREPPVQLSIGESLAHPEPLPVVEWSTEDLGAGGIRHAAVLENGERFFLEDPDRYELTTERAPYVGVPPHTGMLAYDPSGVDLPATASLMPDQSGLKHQGHRRTCVIHAVAAAMEAQLNRQGVSVDLAEHYGHHLNKMTYLHASPNGSLSLANVGDNDALLEGFENFLGFSGGSAIKHQLAMFSRYGLTEESVVPYRGRWRADYENPASDGSDPSLAWNDQASATQRTVNDYNLAEEPRTMHTGSVEKEYVPLPREALETARYRIGDYAYWNAIDTELIEYLIAEEGREVLFTARVGTCADTSDGVWTVGTEDNCPFHAMVIVGYDRTADPSVFVVKNSNNQYEDLSYEYVEEMCTDMGVLVGPVEIRPPDTVYLEQFLGRWTLRFDGSSGTLDIRRLPHFFDAAHLEGEQDRRLGEYYDIDGTTHRVNGSVTETAHGGEIEFHIDLEHPHAGYDDTDGLAFTGRLSRGDTGLMAGTYEDVDGTEAGFYASKDGFVGGHADGWPSTESFAGEWQVHSPVQDGSLTVGVGADGSIAGEYYYDGPFFMVTSGSLDTATNAIEIDLPAPGPDWQFTGYILPGTTGTATGFLSTAGGNERHPAVLTREGPATASIRIDEPESGAALDFGATVVLSATVREDGQELADPLVYWTLDQPYESGGDSGLIVGTSAHDAAKFGPGTHTIYANYLGGPEALDSVTVTVDDPDGPSVAITDPEDGTFYSMADIDPDASSPVTTIDLEGSATTATGGALDGEDLVWSVRRNDGPWQDAGTGESSSVALESSGCGGDVFDIRLEATDEAGRTGTSIVTVDAVLIVC